MVFDPISKILGHKKRVQGDYFSRNASIGQIASKVLPYVVPIAGPVMGARTIAQKLVTKPATQPSKDVSSVIPNRVLIGGLKELQPVMPPARKGGSEFVMIKPIYPSNFRHTEPMPMPSPKPMPSPSPIYITEKPLQLPRPMPVPSPPWPLPEKRPWPVPAPQPPEKRPWPVPQPPRYGGLYPGDRPGGGRIVPLTGSEVFGGGNMAEFPRPTRMLESLQARSPTVFRTQKLQRLPEEII